MEDLTNKLLRLEAPTGLAGDMLMAALLDMGCDFDGMEERLLALPLENWRILPEPGEKLGFRGLHMNIETETSHCHRHLTDILAMIKTAHFPPQAETLACRTFTLLAQAEAAVHGCSPQEVHFHEVGAVDSILDICGCALLLDELDMPEVYCSTLPYSTGYVTCAHGNIPVPAPAAAELLTGFTLQDSGLSGELITPTGAALLKALNAKQSPMPDFRIIKSGVGLGTRDLPVPNALRVFLGERETGFSTDTVAVITANTDDTHGEILAAASKALFAAGALDVSFLPLTMKKSRPGWQIQVIAPPTQGEALARLLMAETTVIGCRIRREDRLIQDRKIITVNTPFGDIPVKISGNNMAPEADAVAQLAGKAHVSWKTVYEAALFAAMQEEK